jgi:DNA-binding beta-propeller fold protein YncE
MNSRNRWLVFALLLAPALAAGATIQGPELGFVFDSAKRELRPILGIPGAAVLGEAVATDAELRRAAVSPQQNYVLAVAGEHNQVFVIAMNHTPLTPVPVQGADRGPDQIALSAGGRAAVLYYKNRNRMEVVTGLPESPKVTSELYLSAGQYPSTVAIGDDGGTVLAGVGAALYQITAGGEVPVLTELGKVSAIAVPATGTAIIADSAHSQIHRVRGIGGGIEANVIAGPKDGISSPVAVTVSRDGSRAFVANGKGGTVSVIGLKLEGVVTKIACGCTPTGLARLAGDEVFRLTEISSRPLWMLEAGAHEPRILFVPADPARSSQK